MATGDGNGDGCNCGDCNIAKQPWKSCCVSAKMTAGVKFWVQAQKLTT